MTTAATEPAAPRRLALPAALAWLRRHPEMFPLALIVVFALGIGAVNPSFWQLANLFDILRSASVTGLFALGVLVVLAAGGLDVSFTAVAALVMYTLVLAVNQFVPGLGIVPILAVAALGGLVLGLMNGVLVNALGVHSLIVTIGTQYAIRGFLLAFIGTALVMNIPEAITRFNQLSLTTQVSDAGFTVRLPAFFLVLVAAAVATWAVLTRTMMGRAIYAVGGNAAIAQRLGYNVNHVRLFVFGYAGMLAGVGGIIHVTSNRLANPFDLAGTELAVIAAVVLGGARITGGTGSVPGTMLGVFLITMVSNNLILVGIPSIWQTAILGGFILLAGVVFGVRPAR